ncbi:hypothetical protein LTR15_001449 [Elasticomyces elasticus]|nr:hypothetical protein LTR15_001449 [Elasticomyces elasticus]
MFAWYRGAAICYVHLADVMSSCAWRDEREPRGPIPVSMTPGRLVENYAASFRDSRYFKRGWTLQEMLAPTYVRFYAKGWTFIGSLYPLRFTVAEFTGIPAAVLGHEKALSECSIAQRLSWAAHRRTAKVEDIAYALLGILGVHLSLNYGEGGDIGANGELSVLAWNNQDEKLCSTLLATSPADFGDCGHVELNPEQRVSEHWMTSRGLKGSFNVVTESTMSTSLALLCHPSTYLSLHCRLDLQSSPSQSHSSLRHAFGAPGASICLRVQPVPTTTAQEQSGVNLIRRAVDTG